MSWTTVPLRSLIRPNNRRNRPDLPLLSVVRDKGIIKRNLDRSDNHNVIPEDLSGYKVVSEGQFVINKMKAWQGSCGVSPYDGIVSPAYFVFDLHGADQKFFNYAIRSRHYVDEFGRISKGIRVDQWDLELNQLKYIHFPIPTHDEQKQIVRYLDWKVSQINKLVNAKKRQIGLLKEQHMAFVNETVARTLDTWQILRAKYLFSERDERSERGEETHLSMSQKFGLVRQDKLEERRTVSVSYAGAKVCRENDLVLNRLKAHLGVFALASEKGVISPDYTVLRPNTEKIIPKYAEYYLKSDACRKELRLRVRGVVEGFWRLYTDDFYTIPIPTPPLKEQALMLELLREKTHNNSKVILTLENEIVLLTEYRTQLVSDVVTGKLDVQGVAVPEYEEVTDVVENVDELEVDE